MIPELEALARRAVACKGWRWMNGMLAETPLCTERVNYGGLPDYRSGVTHDVPPDALPDLTDPATVGCLLALVREAWGRPVAHTRFSRSRNCWEVSLNHTLDRGLCGPTEASALVAALEAAP